MSDRDICLPVGLVGWSQDSIAGRFRDGRSFTRAITALRAESLEVRVAFLAEMGPIRVVEFQGDVGWITLDNRRLHMFRSLLPPGTPLTMRVATYEEAMELKRKLTTRNGGAAIVVRSNRNS